MAEFRYSVVNAMGQPLNGVIEAEDENACRKIIAQRGLFCIAITPVSLASRSIKLGGKVKLKLKEVSVFCRQFSTMLSAGIGVIKSLDIMYKQSDKPRVRAAVKKIYENVQRGQSFSASVKLQDSFPDLTVNMIEAGEASGALDSVMLRLSDHYEKSVRTTNKVKSAMTYPIILCVLTVLVVAIMMVFVMPVFTSMFKASGVSLPVVTRVLVAISNSLTRYLYIYVAVIISIMIIGINFLKNEKGRLAWDKYKTNMLFLGKLNVVIISAKFARTISVLMQSGIPLIKALEITSRVIGNKYFENCLKEAREDIRRGVSLSSAIRKTGVFPVMLISMITIGEESGTLDDVLSKTATFYDEESDKAITKIVSLLEPLMIVIMALIVGFLVVSIIMPMYGMMKLGG